jgi:NADH-quinone oxidoreductase subunit L
MLLLIPALPFVGFLLNASLGHRLTRRASGTLAVAAIVAAFAVSLRSVVQLVGLPGDERGIVQRVFSWIASGSFEVDFTLRLDPLSAVMILIITGIGALVHIYSVAYMHDERDEEFARYFSYLNLFAAFMLVLVLGANFLVLFVGWEGVGLCSYLLIGFYYTKRSAADAGKKAFIVNRVGDVGFILGVLLLVVRFGSVDFAEIANAAAGLGVETTFGLMSAATLLLFVGATGKSAQIPLYVWLPDAMEGPTPVSALIHAATMVTAGVYMIARNAVLFSHAPWTLHLVAVTGILTALIASTIALVQNDIKRVLAYSTVSQLGLMFLALGVGAFSASVFHLYTHAFFKALLFLGSGAVIHALAGEQDIRRMGGLKADLPLTYWTFLVGALAIAGVPGLAGFFSKDEILHLTYASGHRWLWLLGLLTSLLTAVYMFRLVFLVFHGERPTQTASVELLHAGEGVRGEGEPAHREHGAGRLHDAPGPMAFALIVLAAGSILAGYAGLPGVLGGSNRLEAFLEPDFAVSTTVGPVGEADLARRASGGEGAEALERALMGVSTVVALGGIAAALFLFLIDRTVLDAISVRLGGLHNVLLNKYFVDDIYDAALVQPVKALSREGLWKIVDAGLVDGAVSAVAWLPTVLGARLRRLQTGSVRVYAASLVTGIVLVLGYCLWR